jgi:hypothetical protein
VNSPKELIETRPFGTGRHSPVRARIPAHVLAAAREFRERPSAAAIHEAAHAHVAERFGYRARAFVDRGGQTGRTYLLDRPCVRYVTGPDGRRHRDGLGALRAVAAIRMAGVIGEFIRDGHEIPDVEDLLRAEGLSERNAQAFNDNPLQPFVVDALGEFRGDRADALRWLEAMLSGVRRQVIADLRASWQHVVAEARELDRKARAA